MIAVDSGVFLALADRTDRWHARAKAHWDRPTEHWITTWPVLTEACHLLSSRLDPRFAAWLMDDAAEGNMDIWVPPRDVMQRIPSLMRRYANLPMDLADASLVLLAEHLGHGRILSTDERDFESYRWKSREPFHNLLA